MENGECREMDEISTILLDQQSKLWLADPLPLIGKFPGLDRITGKVIQKKNLVEKLYFTNSCA